MQYLFAYDVVAIAYFKAIETTSCYAQQNPRASLSARGQYACH